MDIGRKLIRLLDSVVNLVALSALLLLLAYGCYAIWDSQQLYAGAGSSRYEIYKPRDESSLSFQELQRVNPEVFGWLTVYGTNIDYPLTQGEDNQKYVNTAADGTYSLSGSLFLDYRNQNDFSDFNSIIYGHHMDKKVMFGELGSFREADYFEARRYGRIYYGGVERGLEFFAFLEIDAYDDLYRPGITGTEEQEGYLAKVREVSVHFREGVLTEDPRLVLLSTCASGSTNGRHILVGVVTDYVEEDTFYQEPETKRLTEVDGKKSLGQRLQELPIWMTVLLIGSLVIPLTVVICWGVRKGRNKRGGSV